MERNDTLGVVKRLNSEEMANLLVIERVDVLVDRVARQLNLGSNQYHNDLKDVLKD